MSPFSIIDYLPLTLSVRIVEVDTQGNLLSKAISASDVLEDGCIDYIDQSTGQ